MQVVLKRTTSPGVYTYLDRFRVIKIDPKARKSKWELEDLSTGQKHPLGRMSDGVVLIETLFGGSKVEDTTTVREKPASKAKTSKPESKGPPFIDRIKKLGFVVQVVAWTKADARKRLGERYMGTVVLGLTKLSGGSGVLGYRMTATIVPLRDVWAGIPRLLPK